LGSDLHRYTVGDIAVTVFHDGGRSVDAAGFVTNAPIEEVAALLAAAGLPTDKINNGFAPVMLETGGKRVLFDTGNGEAVFNSSNGAVGRLHGHLQAAGISRDSIDIVVCTHFHADHVNGLLMADGTPAFPRAEIKVPEVEWAFWMSDAEMARAPAGRMQGLFQNNRRVFDALKRNVTPFAWDTDVASGVKAIGTPGHSIGHTSCLVTSGAASVLVQADICNHAVIFAQRPDWHGWFDQDAAQAAATRRRIYDMVTADRIPVQAYHFPFPGFGRMEKSGAGYRFVAGT
jgi:glyoxylase-like metal-dependent hydrolase (beta-lactamase superfamily II)